MFLLVVIAFARGSGIDPQVAGAVGGVALAVLVVGVAWTVVATRRVHVTASSPADAVVGEDVALRVGYSGPLTGVLIRDLDPPGGWVRPELGTNVLLHRADTRGVFRSVRIEVWCRGGLGVLSQRRIRSLDLAHDVLVAPRAVPVRWVPGPVVDEAISATAAFGGHHAGEVARAVRPYSPGDPARMVHWPSSLRAGSLVVRELEPPVRTGLAVVLAMVQPGPSAEDAASRAMGQVRAVLAGGGDVVLSTCEPGGTVLAPVTTVREAGRRLARAVPGTPAPAPRGWPVEVFRG